MDTFAEVAAWTDQLATHSTRAPATIRRYTSDADAFVRWRFHTTLDHRLSQVTAGDARDYRDALLAAGHASSTINRIRFSLAVLLDAHGHQTNNPFRRLRPIEEVRGAPKDLLDGHTPAAGGLSYDIMFNIARRQLLLGLSVICDSPFAYPESYRRAVAISAEAAAAFVIVECRCSDENLWRSRIEARQTRSLPAHHTTTWAAIDTYQARNMSAEPFEMDCPVLRIDSVEPVSASCAELVAWFKRQES